MYTKSPEELKNFKGKDAVHLTQRIFFLPFENLVVFV